MVTSSKVLDVLLTYFGGFKSKHPMRANQGPSPVSTPTPPIKTLMCTSWDSGALLVEEYEALIKAFPELNPELAERVGQRTGGRKAMYLSRKDFERRLDPAKAMPVLHRRSCQCCNSIEQNKK